LNEQQIFDLTKLIYVLNEQQIFGLTKLISVLSEQQIFGLTKLIYVSNEQQIFGLTKLIYVLNEQQIFGLTKLIFQVPSAAALKLRDFSFNDFVLDENETLQVGSKANPANLQSESGSFAELLREFCGTLFTSNFEGGTFAGVLRDF